MPATLSDTDLYAAFASSQQQAVQTVYRLYFKPLCFFAGRITGEREQAYDLVTDSFLKMLQRKTEFQSLDNVKHFLYLTTRNACLNWLRNEKRHDAAHRQLLYLQGGEGEELTDGLKAELLRLEVLQAIHAEIENLPDRCRETVRLIFIEGLSTEEVAERLSVSAQTVRSQKSRGLELVRSQLIRKKLLSALLLLAVLTPPEKIYS